MQWRKALLTIAGVGLTGFTAIALVGAGTGGSGGDSPATTNGGSAPATTAPAPPPLEELNPQPPRVHSPRNWLPLWALAPFRGCNR